MITDFDKALAYIRNRNEIVDTYYDRADSLLADAARELVRIAYSYGHDGRVFEYGMSASMMREVDVVIAALVALIEDAIDELATACAGDDEADGLLDYINSFYNESIHDGVVRRADRFLIEIEALVCVAMIKGYGVRKAVEVVPSLLDSPWTSDFWKSGIEEAGGNVKQPILKEGMITYGAGHTNVSRNAFRLFGNGFITTAWMRRWRDTDGSNADVFRSIVADENACSECKEEDARGWQPMSEYPDGAWHPRCRCVFIFANNEDI